MRPFAARRWKVLAVGGTALLTLGVSAAPSTAQLNAPEIIGALTLPFEEGGSEAPRCTPDPRANKEVVCKPVAQAVGVLKDGRIFYFNGIEGHENMKNGTGTDLSPEMRDSEARVMDLRSGTPTWITPLNPDGGATNPDIKQGHEGTDDPFGMAGVPGRPGDGLVGSTWGQAGLPEQSSTSSPDDPGDNDVDMFCADLVSLADGRIMVIGGSDWYNEPVAMDQNGGDPRHLGLVEVNGLRNSRIYDPDTNAFSQAGHMKYQRWYPSGVTLSDGKVFVASGVVKLIKSTQLSNIRRTETWDPATNAYTENYVGPESENTMPTQPRLFLTPNGKVFYTGFGQSWVPFGQAADEAMWGFQQFFDLETKKWEVTGLAPGHTRDIAHSLALPMEAPYDKMDILTFGGALGPSPGSWVATGLSSITSVDKAGNVTNELVGNMKQGRWFPSGTLLLDGKVLATTGARLAEPIMPGGEVPVRTIEMWDPATGEWSEMMDSQRDRTYHNSAVMMPDGRVLIGGHSPVARFFGNQQDAGKPFPNNEKDPSFEIYSPPYLFRGERPTISTVQGGLRWGETFDIATPDAAGIEDVVLYRVPSPQHVNDSDARMLKLDFTRTGNGLSAVTPPDGIAAPPGMYMLFVNKTTPEGIVPSMARMVRVGPESDPAEALQPVADGTGAAAGSANPDIDTSGTAEVSGAVAEQMGGMPSQPSVTPHVEATTSLDAVPASAPGALSSVPAAAPVAVLTAGFATAYGWRRSRRWRNQP